MTDTFEHAIHRILAEEGDYANTPGDTGGETRYGLARRHHPDIPEAKWVRLTRADAVEVYRVEYWERIGGDSLPPAIACALLDAAVNQGPTAAISMLQRCLGVPADGVMGPITRSALRRRDLRALLVDFFAERMMRYASTTGWAAFGLGWSRRAFRMFRASLELV